MREGTATALLREQHRLILSVVDAFSSAACDAAALPDPERLDSFITFFRLFTDACHHGSEEDVLFTAMEEHGLAGTDGPLDAMREEHRFGRTLVRAMADAAAALRTGEVGAGAAFHAHASAYVAFIRAHIAREDDGLFELADNQIHGHACAALCDAYEVVCLRRFEGLSVGALEHLAGDLIAGRAGQQAPSTPPLS
jgi:hemerythrin-like domain-containing protein